MSESQRLRILICCTKFGVGGIARHALELGAWLRSRGHEVAFAGTPGAWLDASKEARFVALDTQGASTGDYGAGIASRVTSLLRSAATLRGWLRRNRVDIIHAHETAPALTARLATLGRRTPIALTFHGAEPERLSQYGAIAKLAATQIISVSENGAELLRDIGGVPAEKLTAIGLGVKPPPAADPARAAALRKQLLGENGTILAVTIARLSAQKGIDVLIETSLRVRQARPDIKFALVGDGPDEPQLRALAAARGALEGLTFVGRSDEAHLYLKAADFFLLTSRWEALPYTIVEAFQAARPVIATDCGGVRELITVDTGFVVPIGDISAISGAVLNLASDESLRERMSAGALERSHADRFQPDIMCARIEALYQSMAAAR